LDGRIRYWVMKTDLPRLQSIKIGNVKEWSYSFQNAPLVLKRIVSIFSWLIDLYELQTIECSGYCFANSLIDIESTEYTELQIIDCINLQSIRLGEGALGCYKETNKPGYPLILKSKPTFPVKYIDLPNLEIIESIKDSFLYSSVISIESIFFFCY
jgi:hypothetical protein